MNLSWKKFLIIVALALFAATLVGPAIGTLINGQASEAAATANSAYEDLVSLTPGAPLVYPADFVVCKGGMTETITVEDDLQWNYQVLLANEEAQKGNLYFGPCH